MARQRETQYFYNAIDNAIEKLERAMKEKPMKLIEDIGEEAKSIIAHWYAGYPSPIYYRRNRSLYRAYKLEQDGVDVSIKYGPEFLEDASYAYHQSTEYVFDTVFVGGYHGGSVGTDKRTGVVADVPTWRTPFKKYTRWSSPAPQDSPPRDEIEQAAQKLMDEYDKSWDDDLGKIMNSIRRSYKGYMRR